MAAVEDAQPDAVELVVVFAAEALAALVVFPDPRFEALFDLLQLVARRFGFLHVDDDACRSCGRDRKRSAF